METTSEVISILMVKRPEVCTFRGSGSGWGLHSARTGATNFR